MAQIIAYMDEDADEKLLIGRIDKSGNVYAIESDDEILIGTVDYDSNQVFDEEGELLGFLENGRDVISVYEDEDGVNLGNIAENGEVMVFIMNDDEELEEYPVGIVENMRKPVDGAAAMIFFFDLDEDDEDDEEW